jgi:predicted nucleic acid-binding protein
LIALDTNILIYAEDAEDSDGRREQALALMDVLAPVGAIIPLQVLGEFLNVCRSKGILAFDLAATQASLYAATFDAPPTALDDLLDGATLAAQHRLQFFDAVIIAVARRAGATILLSEDMHDGLVIDGLTVLNPFNDANAPLLADMLGSAL